MYSKPVVKKAFCTFLTFPIHFTYPFLTRLLQPSTCNVQTYNLQPTPFLPTTSTLDHLLLQLHFQLLTYLLAARLASLSCAAHCLHVFLRLVSYSLFSLTRAAGVCSTRVPTSRPRPRLGLLHCHSLKTSVHCDSTPRCRRHSPF